MPVVSDDILLLVLRLVHYVQLESIVVLLYAHTVQHVLLEDIKAILVKVHVIMSQLVIFPMGAVGILLVQQANIQVLVQVHAIIVLLDVIAQELAVLLVHMHLLDTMWVVLVPLHK